MCKECKIAARAAWSSAPARYTAAEMASLAPRGVTRAPLWLAGLLLALLALLAALQYHLIGEVSRAEGQRLRASLEASAQRFAADVDRELARVFAAFALPPSRDGAGREERLRQRLEDWRERAPYPRLVGALFLAEPGAGGEWGLRRFDPDQGRFEPAAWPEDLAALRQIVRHGPPFARPGPGRGVAAQALAAPLAIVAPVALGDEPAGLAVVRLDRAGLSETLLPELAARHFSGSDGLDYDLAIVPRDPSGEPLWTSGPEVDRALLRAPDASAVLFALRPFAEFRQVHARHAPDLGHDFGPPPDERRFVPGPHRRGARFEGGFEGRGAWLLLVRHRRGSLEKVVAQARVHNLVVSAGILSLLGVSIAFLAASTRRAQRLARQQLEFVAGVTHELHTPLAGIRSAAQNLKDGVVAEAEQVRRYGGLIEKESRRLSELLEQVLQFAGIQSGRRALRRERLDARALVEEALLSCRFVFEEQGATVESALGEAPLAVEGDPDALRAAFRNVLQNAAKYGGGWVRVTARADAGQAEVRVEDRGPGIAPDERARVFEPFYRGRNAAAGQAPGTGLGLGIVRDVLAAHGGRVDVRPREGGGSCFALRLPLAAGGAA